MAMGGMRNNYEQAFENWLADNKVQHVAVDQHRRRIFARSKIKSFDFIVYPQNRSLVITDVKGRKFKGASLSGLRGIQCWVTMEDIRGLLHWQEIFSSQGSGCEPVFVFAYEFEKIDVETDGVEVYDFGGRKYVFYAISLEDYREFMKLRSPKWQTVTLPVAKFRQLAVEAKDFLLGYDG